VPEKYDKTLREIEDTQAALRESIEQAKSLAEESDKLLRKLRKKRSAMERPPSPATVCGQHISGLKGEPNSES
jgi:hypothetical protein